MKVRLRKGVFIRHAGEESVVWCPNTGGCTVMENAGRILDEVTREWRDVGEIARAVAERLRAATTEKLPKYIALYKERPEMPENEQKWSDTESISLA